MTPSDELWIEMAEFDTDMADGIWQGNAAPADTPSWYGRVATLVRVAQSPARADELAAEDEIVALMRKAVMESRAESGEAPELELVAAGTDVADVADVDEPEATEAPEPAEPVRLHAVGSEPGDAPARPRHMKLNGNRPQHMKARHEAAGDSDDEDADEDDEPGRGGRFVRRLVAVKAVAATTAFVVGVTAAAAATGIVTVVVPAARDRLLTHDKDEPSHVVDDDGSSDGSGSGRGSSDSPRSCAGEGPACTTADGTRVTPGTDGSGGSAGDPATDSTDAQSGGSSTETTIEGDGTTTDPAGGTTDTTAGGDGTPTTEAPPTTEEPPTTDPPPTTEEPPTTTEPTPVQPMSDEGAQGDGGDSTVDSAAASTDTTASAGGADLVETMAAVDPGPAADPAADLGVSQG